MIASFSVKGRAFAAFTMLISVFFLDVNSPYAYLVCLLYLPGFYVLGNSHPKATIGYCVLALILTAVRVLISDNFEMNTGIIINRIFSSLGLLFFAFLSYNLSSLNRKYNLNYKDFYTQLKDKDVTIKDKEKLFYNLMENMLEGVQLISHDHRYLYVNKAVVEQSGYKKEDLLGYSMSFRYPGIENTELMKKINDALEQKKSTSYVNKFTYPDGKIGYFELFMQPVDEGVFILSIDITDRINGENKRILYTNELEEMLKITSHKVRPPVANLLGLINIFDSKALTEEDQEKFQSYIKLSCLRLEVFIKELNDFMTKSKGRMIS